MNLNNMPDTAILDELKDIIDYDEVTFFEVDGYDTVVLLHRGRAPEAERYPWSFSLIPMEAEGGADLTKPIIISDVHGSSQLARAFQKMTAGQIGTIWSYIGSTMAIPMLVDGHILGWLTFGYRQKGYYTSLHAEAVLDFIERNKKRLQRVVAHARTLRRSEEFDALLRIQHSITSYLDIDVVLQMVADEAQRLCGSQSAMVYLLEGENLCLAAAAGHGIIPPCDKVHILPDGTLVGQAELASMPRRILYESDEPGSGDRLRNVMSVPLVSGDRPLGALMLVDKTVGTFGPADERLLNSLAATAVIGLDNARLYAQAEETSRLQERQRIAQALHDTIAQMLFSIGLEVKKAQALPQIDDSTRSALNTIGRLSERSSHELRNAILALRRPEYETGHNLLRLVQDQVDEFRAKSGIAATLLAPLELETLSPPVNEAIYRVVGEALANVYKHSKASVVVIGLHLEDDWITVTIQDDGVGLDDLATALPDEDDLRFGIATMRQIVEQARGEFLINNNDDGGVTVRVRLPITIKVET